MRPGGRGTWWWWRVTPPRSQCAGAEGRKVSGSDRTSGYLQFNTVNRQNKFWNTFLGENASININWAYIKIGFSNFHKSSISSMKFVEPHLYNDCVWLFLGIKASRQEMLVFMHSMQPPWLVMVDQTSLNCTCQNILIIIQIKVSV